ncbi:hypothetical protein Pfo_023030 [Paulownia fortunei]|nr:hypothetical protein Pfo_023030 [Paulownia fortunei]
MKTKNACVENEKHLDQRTNDGESTQHAKSSPHKIHFFALSHHHHPPPSQIINLNLSLISTPSSTIHHYDGFHSLLPPTFQGLTPFNKPTDTLFLNKPTSSATFCRPLSSNKRLNSLTVKAELNPSLAISLSTGLSLFLGRFVLFNFQRENVAKQGVPEQNGVLHFEAGDVRAKEYVSLLKSNDPVGFNVVDVLARDWTYCRLLYFGHLKQWL